MKISSWFYIFIMSFDGLASCSPSTMAHSPICIEKAVEFSFTTVLLIAIVVNLGMRVNYERQVNLYVAINLLMILTLVFNAFYTLLGDSELYRFENLFFDAYFPTLVFKFGIKLLEKNKDSAVRTIRFAVTFYLLYILLVVGDFIYINVENIRYCKEIPYLLIDASGLTLSIWLLIFGYHHMQTERERNEIIRQEVVSDSSNYSNPMPKMWKCIVINILSQVIGLARTVYYVADPAMDCKFTRKETAEECIQFVLLVTTYYMGMVATLFFFNEKRRSYFSWNTDSRKSSDQQKVELINITVFDPRASL